MGEARLDLLVRLLARLEDYARRVDRDTLEHDLDAWLMVSRAMELAVQCCVDLGLSIISRRGVGLPESYREVFTRLAQEGVIDAALARELEGWAGLRNVLAHLYTTIDLDLVHAAYTTELEPLRAFSRVAAAELSEAEDGGTGDEA